MNVLFEDDGQLKAGAVLADQDASLQVEAASGKRLKIKAGNVLLRFAAPGPRRRAGRRQQARRRARPGISCGRRASDGEFGFADLAREYYGGAADARAVGGGGDAAARVADALLQEGQGPLPEGAARRAQGRARLGRAQGARGRADRRRGWRSLVADTLPEPLRAKLPMLLYKPDKNALEWKALAAACEAAQDQPAAAAGRMRRDSVDARLSLRSRSSPKRFRRASRFPPGARCRRRPSLPQARRARVFDRRRDDDRDRRRVLGARASQRQLRGRHPHRVPGARDAARERARPHRALAAVDGLHARAQADDAAGRGGRGVHAGGGRGTARAVALHRDHARRRAGPPRDARGARAGGREPAPRRDQRRVRQRDLPSPDDPPWTHELRVLWKLAQHLSAQRGKNDINRIDYSFDVDWDAGPDGRVAIVPRERGSPLDKLDRRAHDPRQQHVGTAAGRPRRGRAVPRAGRGQGQDEHASRRAPGARAHALPVGELAAAPLQRSRQPAPAPRRAGGRDAAVRATTMPSCSPRWPISRRPTASTPSSRTGWSTTGACAGCCRKTSPRRPRG